MEYRAAWDRVNAMQADDPVIEGKVIAVNRGGAMVLVEGLRAFLPGSHMVNPGGASEDMLGKVLNNLQVSLTNIHLRYEDRTQSTHPFAIGITLAELSYCTTDADGNRSFSIDEASLRHSNMQHKGGLGSR